jgi:hypothetical protein
LTNVDITSWLGDDIPFPTAVSATHPEISYSMAAGNAYALTATPNTPTPYTKISAISANTPHRASVSAQATPGGTVPTASSLSHVTPMKFSTPHKKITEEDLQAFLVAHKRGDAGTHNRSKYARDRNMCSRALRDLVTKQGSLTLRGKRLLAKSGKETGPRQMPPTVDPVILENKARAIQDTAEWLAKPGSWDFPGADDVFVKVLDGCCKQYELRIELDRGQGREWFGLDNAPYVAGVIRVRNSRYTIFFRESQSEFEIPQNGDRGFHALNALRVAMVHQLYRNYSVPSRHHIYPLLLTPTPESALSIRTMRQVASTVYLSNVWIQP